MWSTWQLSNVTAEKGRLNVTSIYKPGPASFPVAGDHFFGGYFTSDGVEVGVVIRSVELYDLVKTAFWFCLPFCRLRSSENWVAGVTSRSGRTKPITNRANVHCDCYPSASASDPYNLVSPVSLDNKRNVSDGVVSGVARKSRDVLILPTPISSRLWIRYDSDFLLGHKGYCNTTYDSHSDSIAIGNQA